MTYKEWLETVPRVIRDDAVWRVEAYRLAAIIPNERGHALREDETSYSADLLHLLVNPPLPDAEIVSHEPRTTGHAPTNS